MKKIILIAFIVAVLNPFLVYAAEPDAKTTEPVKSGVSSDLPTYNSGVDNSIKDYLCTPSEPADGHDLERCVNRLYRFSLVTGFLVLIFFLVISGYVYITGGEGGKTKAKAMLINSFTGMAVLLGSYVLLYFINPSLVQFKQIQPPIFDAEDMPPCEDVGFGEACKGTGGVAMAGGACAMPLDASKVIKFNGSLHRDQPNTGKGHGPLGNPPANSPSPQGIVDLGVGQNVIPVFAPISGKVVQRRTLSDGTGGWVRITSDVRPGSSGCASGADCTNMGHIDPTVNIGDMVTAGQQIGVTHLYTGKFGPHLHFELKLGGQWITGDGKAGTWNNMKSSIARCMNKGSGGGGGSSVAVDMSKVPSGMVEVTEASHGIKLNMIYATASNFTGTQLYSTGKCYLTKSVADKLKKAQDALKAKGKTLEIYDCYRPTKVQELMNEWAGGSASWAKVKPTKPKSYYVPSYIAASTGGKHPAGKAIDLTISGASMPSGFDEFSEKAHYDANNASAKLLRESMVGLTPFKNEWWHFSE